MGKRIGIAIVVLLLLLLVGGGVFVAVAGGGAVAYYYYVLTGQEPPPELAEEWEEEAPRTVKMPVIEVKEAPKPAPEPAPTKKPVKKAIAKVEAPPPPPPAEPVKRNGGVVITGDKPGVFLLEGADGTRYTVMPEVPPGQYAIIGAWDTESLHGLGTITVSEGETTIKCSVSWGKCSNK